MSEAQTIDRETAREILERKLTRDYDDMILEDARWRLRWIDCAPAGANHQTAPLQDKRGVPCGDARDENVGPCLHLRLARERRGMNPFSGLTRAQEYRLRLLADGVEAETAEVYVDLYNDGYCPGCYLGDDGIVAHTCH